ncbi:c-type cytochrome [Pseudomonadota bacterium]
MTQKKTREALPFFSALAFSLLALNLTSCSSYDDTHDHPKLTTGEALFNHHCSSCHGEDGTGKLADRTPANVLTEKNRFGIVDYITKETDANRKMPVFKEMSTGEANKIATHLIKLKYAYESAPSSKKKPKALLIEP